MNPLFKPKAQILHYANNRFAIISFVQNDIFSWKAYNKRKFYKWKPQQRQLQ